MIEFNVNWKLHDYCPICKQKSLGGCRCFLSDQICKNGHHWYVCPLHLKTVIGKSDHSIDTMICRCDETAFERTEI
jgi:hypothetical protein